MWLEHDLWGELTGRGQIIQGFEGQCKALRFYSKWDVGPRKGFKQGDDSSNVFK